MSQTEMFFRLASSLRNAVRAGDAAGTAEAADELAVLWLHSDEAAVRQRCESILSAHGMAGALDTISAQGAAE